MIAAIVKLLTGGLLDKILDIGKQYLTNDRDRADFDKQVRIAAQETAAKMEETWAQAATEAAKATSETVKTSPILQRAWAAVLFLQVAVLVWYQVGSPAYQVITGTAWPSPGVTLEWAYLLVATMLGAGPLVLRR
jgi:hypothetical protein